MNLFLILLIPAFQLLSFSNGLNAAIPVQRVPENHSLRLVAHSNQLVSVPGLVRVAVGNSKIVKVQAIPPSGLLLTALKPGSTLVRTWDKGGSERAYAVRVLSSLVETPANTESGRDVVKIALEFLELDSAFSRTTGFRWPEALQFSGLATLTGNAAMSGLNYEVGLASAKGWIHHLVTEGWARMVANPDLYVRLGEQAVFHSGGEFPVASSTENYGKSYRHVEWKPYGLTAKVRPDSVDRLHISSDINLELSELSSSQTIDGLPSLTRRRLVTKMNSTDGETVILSGLVKQNSSREKEGVPVLSSIPLLGGLFSKTSERNQETELLMAVTFTMTTKASEEKKRVAIDKKLKSVETIP